MGLGDVGFAGGKVIETPNLDKQASKGKIFTQYYTTAPVSSASRVALTTGMYHIRWNINMPFFITWPAKIKLGKQIVLQLLLRLI